MPVKYFPNCLLSKNENNLVGVVLLSVKTHHTTTTDVITFLASSGNLGG
jgi:hypothetical protein